MGWESLSRSFLERQENVGTLGLDCPSCQKSFPCEISSWQQVKFCCLCTTEFGGSQYSLVKFGHQTLSFGNKGHYSAIHLREYYHKKSILPSLTEEECLALFLPFTWSQGYCKLHVTFHTPSTLHEKHPLCSLYADIKDWNQNNQHKQWTKTLSKSNNIFLISKNLIPTSLLF